MRGSLKPGLILVILLFSMVSPAWAQYLYLIENNLANPIWVANQNNLFFNSTLEAWQLNKTDGAPPAYIDFTTFSELAGGYLSQIETRSTWANLDRTDEGNAYLDDYLPNDYTVYFTLRLTDIESNTGGTVLVYPFIAAENPYTDWNALLSGNYEAYGIRVNSPLSQSSSYTLTLIECQNGGAWGQSLGESLTVGTDYYIKLEKAGTSWSAWIYSDPTYSSLLDTETLDLQEAHLSENCLCVPLAQDASNGPRTSSGYVEYLTFDEPGGGYELEGIYYSEDLLINTTMGPAYLFGSDQIVPAGASLVVSFSEDNLTWVRPIILSSTLGDLRETVYLGDLNYSSLYVRYNFTGDGSATPELHYMSLAYRIADPGPGGNGWIYLVASPIMLALGLVVKSIKPA